MQKQFLLSVFLAASALSVCVPRSAFADTDADSTSSATDSLVQPQWLLNLDGVLGVRTEPIAESGHAVAGLGPNLEYVPSVLPELGWDLGYEYLVESRDAEKRDNTVDAALRWYLYTRPAWSAWIKGGIGYNLTPNTVNGHYLAVVEPGLRVALFSHLAVDLGVQYMSQTPKSAFVQSFGVQGGFSIPLDAGFQLFGGREASAGAAPVVVGNTQLRASASNVPLRAPGPGGLPWWAGGGVQVLPGDTLWTLAKRVWGDGALWPLFYMANRRQVSDPNSIHAGAKLWYRSWYTPAEIAAARRLSKGLPGRGRFSR